MLENKTVIRPFQPGDAADIQRMIIRVFHAFFARDMNREGMAEFLDHIRPAKILERVGHTTFAYIALSGECHAGYLEMGINNHVTLFFVDSEFQNQGIGKQLFQTAAAECGLINPQMNTIDVNSSIYAVPIYEKLGFEKCEEEKMIKGIRHQPMVHALPPDKVTE